MFKHPLSPKEIFGIGKNKMQNCITCEPLKRPCPHCPVKHENEIQAGLAWA